jgi:hypothetical protein
MLDAVDYQQYDMHVPIRFLAPRSSNGISGAICRALPAEG